MGYGALLCLSLEVISIKPARDVDAVKQANIGEKYDKKD